MSDCDQTSGHAHKYNCTVIGRLSRLSRPLLEISLHNRIDWFQSDPHESLICQFQQQCYTTTYLGRRHIQKKTSFFSHQMGCQKLHGVGQLELVSYSTLFKFCVLQLSKIQTFSFEGGLKNPEFRTAFLPNIFKTDFAKCALLRSYIHTYIKMDKLMNSHSEKNDKRTM